VDGDVELDGGGSRDGTFDSRSNLRDGDRDADTMLPADGAARLDSTIGREDAEAGDASPNDDGRAAVDDARVSRDGGGDGTLTKRDAATRPLDDAGRRDAATTADATIERDGATRADASASGSEAGAGAYVEGDGCSCRMGRDESPPGAGLAVLLLLTTLGARRRSA
jgi:MYXO-CTERM domain-containing protein